MKFFRSLRRTYIPPTPLPATETITARRLLISPDMLPENEGANINVPSLIRVPDWVDGRLGRYYLYFASHSGSRHVRLSIADRIDGPWRIHSGGVLRASEVPEIGDHVGAPDVHVDHDLGQIRMYFHAHSKPDSRFGAMLAVSKNGIDFQVRPKILGGFYFRAFEYGDAWYALSKGGRLYRSGDGQSSFVRGRDLFPRVPWNGRRYNASGSVRHVSIEVESAHAHVFFTRIGDTPERILKSRVDLERKWRKWHAGPPEEVMRPSEAWEGADLEILPSSLGSIRRPACQLRDPEIFKDDDGKRYLLYAVAGEQGIGLAHLG